jgi:acetoin utilization protein AcuC
MKKKKYFIHCKRLDKLLYPVSSPFNTSRAGEVRKILDSMGLLEGEGKELIGPKAAGREVLEKFHSREYLDTMLRAEAGEFDNEMLFMGLGTGDNPIFEGMYEYGALATGATVLGAEKILAGEAAIAFNPSGGLHHAHPGRASGFCYINDVVLGCMTLAEKGKKVLYLDVDVHHGDGTQEAFYDRKDVMTVSMHQNGRTLFPGTGFVEEWGMGEGKGYSINVPLPPGTYDEIYLKAFGEAVLPLIKVFGPDVFVMEIGADALAGDPLAGLMLTNNVYVEIIEKLHTFGVPILATGGGGYNIKNTVRAWALAWTALCGDAPGREESAGMGGVMLESTDWQGGLRDKALEPTKGQRDAVDSVVEEVIAKIKKKIFPMHGI